MILHNDRTKEEENKVQQNELEEDKNNLRNENINKGDAFNIGSIIKNSEKH